MNGRMAKNIRRRVRAMEAKAFADALECFTKPPFFKRLGIAWAILWRIHLRRVRKGEGK